MRILRSVRENPIAILCLALLGLIGWVAADLAKPAKQNARQADTESFPAIGEIEVVGGITSPSIAHQPSLFHPVFALRPGMKRIEVEQLLGTPDADRVQPITAVDGRVTYRTAYELSDVDAPMTVRPIRPLPRMPRTTARSNAPVLIALEFDATQPGHPLVEVLYLDPLF